MSEPRRALANAVAKALHDLGEDSSYFIEWESESEADRAEYRTQADTALSVFAEWLRERVNMPGMLYRASAELQRLADEIKPPEGRRDE